MTSVVQASANDIAHGVSVMFSAHWMTRQLDDLSHDLGFPGKQLDAPSIGMLLAILYKCNSVLYWISSSVHNFYLSLL